ncbi:MFS transporter [Paenibacillus beijingensis]|uniref:Major facilitator transporter n=1 Tax=Paenibacillus beijingensis TaxID=1126833 RepID=A0A0D5NRL4_9BACL|nr:MFS transporter [Paenibacillus beijingensis]AJY77617.1 major facilitator transporter [Paenibacillus beijingensis]
MMAAACGFAVANVYLNQTLLVDMARTFGSTEAAAGAVTTLAQVGYALGNLLLVPLGDIIERRRLILILSGMVCLSLASAALSGSIGWLIASNFAIGFTTVIPQIVVPLAAGMANDGSRGKVLGTVAIGLVCGILGARFVSGLVDSVWGWRAMYWIALACMIALGALIRFRLPQSKGSAAMPYGRLLLSLGPLFRQEAVLRRACLSQGMVFGAFSLFFTTAGFLLQSPSYGYGSAVVGLVGLVGIGGAFATPVIGRVIDRKGAAFANVLCMLAALVSFLIAAAGQWLPVLIAGALLLTIGTQANQVACQAQIFSLAASARSRLNGLYMVCTFLGGALGSYLGVWAWSRWHWMGVCICGIAMVAVGLSTARGKNKLQERPQTIRLQRKGG